MKDKQQPARYAYWNLTDMIYGLIGADMQVTGPDVRKYFEKFIKN